MNDASPTTPRDWARWLTESARDGSTWLSVDQARRLALVLEGLVATVEQLETECHRLQELRTSPSWRGVTRAGLRGLARVPAREGSRCTVCVHRAVDTRGEPCRSCMESGMASEYRPDPALEGGRHE